MNPTTEYGKQAYQVLFERWPAYATSLHTNDSRWHLQEAADGECASWSVNGYRLASAWDQRSEAELQCAHVPHDAADVTLFGVGMGILPPVILNKLGQGGTLRVVPLNRCIFAQMLDRVDMTSWLSHPSVELIDPEDVTELPAQPVISPALLSVSEPNAEWLRDCLQQWLSATHMASYQSSSHEACFRNIQSNILLCKADPDISELFASGDLSSECVVAGAGPSLERAYPKIKELQERGASVLCVDAALVPLLSADIKPDIVVSIEPRPMVQRFFEGLQSLDSSALVYFPVIAPEVLQMWPCRRWRAVSRNSLYDEFLSQCPTTALFSSGSVIHPTVDVAVRTGAQRIYLTGADFCYPFDSTHAQGVAVAQSSESIADEKFSVRNYLDELVPSQMNFVSYYRDLERYISWCSEKGLEFFNIGHHSARLSNVNWIES
ncbi:MAG: motility associated factor glycosyltransferase family protein [Granulosicoccus sp.]